MLKAISAMSSLKGLAAALTPPEFKAVIEQMGHEVPVNTEDRRHAGFAVE